MNIVNNIVNDVALTILADSAIDPLTGLSTVCQGIATDGGVSVIDGPAGVGTVVDASSGVLVSGDIGEDMWSVHGTSGDVDRWGDIPAVDSVAPDKTYTNAVYPQLLGVATVMA